MRRLWTEPTVHFDGAEHRIDGAGIAPLPVHRPIPVWMGAERDPRAFDRVGRLADGWMALGPPSEEASERLDLVRAAAKSAGRDPAEVGWRRGSTPPTAIWSGSPLTPGAGQGWEPVSWPSTAEDRAFRPSPSTSKSCAGRQQWWSELWWGSSMIGYLLHPIFEVATLEVCGPWRLQW